MKVYLVQNNDGMVIAICSTPRKANTMVTTIGNNRWHEAWKVIPVSLDEIDPSMLSGSESYQRMLKKIAERENTK